VKYLNSKCKYVVFEELPSVPISEKLIRTPSTHNKYLKNIKALLEEDDYIILVTDKQYDNNYFYDSAKGLIILSLYAWKYLTTLSKENGLIYLICGMFADEIVPVRRVNHDARLGCVNDFLYDKTRVDDGMRKGHFCAACKKYIKKSKLTAHQSKLLKDLNGLLRELAIASKAERNIITNEEAPLEATDKIMTLGMDDSVDTSKPATSRAVKKQKKLRPGAKIEAATLFISYSHKDEKDRNDLEAHLSVLYNEGILEGWSDRQIAPGDYWEKRINEKIKSAKIILLLISKNFLASKYCYGKEMEIALERSERGDAITIPVILRNCLWEASRFANLQALPQARKSIQQFKSRDDGYYDVVGAIWKQIAGK
jgi:hypothetical protein